jgi:hypothetical protein
VTREIKPGLQERPYAVRLGEDEAAWVQKKWRAIRERQALADAASNTWDRLNDELNTYLDAHRITDVVQRDRIKGESLEFNGALASHGWNAREAQRHIDDVQLFLRLKEMGLL